MARNGYKNLERALTNPNVQVLCANCHAIKTVQERHLGMRSDSGN